MTEWPDDICDFAFIPDPVVRIKELSEEAEQEDWSYHHTETEHHHPLLFNFIRYAYRRVTEERKIAISDDGQYTSP